MQLFDYMRVYGCGYGYGQPCFFAWWRGIPCPGLAPVPPWVWAHVRYIASTCNVCAIKLAPVHTFPQCRVLASLEGRTKRATGVAFASAKGNVLLSRCCQTARRACGGGRGPRARGKGRAARGPALPCCRSTARRRWFVTGGADTTWALYDLASLVCLQQVCIKGYVGWVRGWGSGWGDMIQCGGGVMAALSRRTDDGGVWAGAPSCAPACTTRRWCLMERMTARTRGGPWCASRGWAWSGREMEGVGCVMQVVVRDCRQIRTHDSGAVSCAVAVPLCHAAQ